MSRVLVLVGFSVLAMHCAYAQEAAGPSAMQCRLVKQAVAQYGYAAARAHALETYGPEAVRMGDKCFTQEARAGGAAHSRRELRVERADEMRYRR